MKYKTLFTSEYNFYSSTKTYVAVIFSIYFVNFEIIGMFYFHHYRLTAIILAYFGIFQVSKLFHFEHACI